MMHELGKLTYNLMQVLTAGLLFTVAGWLLLPSWKSAPAIVIGSFIWGFGWGFLALVSPLPVWVSPMTAALATISAPPTALAFSNRTLADLIDELRDMISRRG